jgi:4-hydroxybenzoyl-CoA reductase subunit alpha
MHALIVESVDPEGPYGAKEAGEGPLHPAIPAIANAIHDAVGVRLDSLPFSPPRVWRAIQAAKGRAFDDGGGPPATSQPRGRDGDSPTSARPRPY